HPLLELEICPQHLRGKLRPPPGSYTGTTGDDKIRGTAGDDDFDMSQGGNDVVKARGGGDYIYFGDAFTADDNIDGGSGDDALELIGDYSAGVTFGASTLTNVEFLYME